MDWRVKALLQGAFSLLPRGHAINYFFQRYVTRTLPSSEAHFIERVKLVRGHLDSLSPYLGRPLGKLCFYEFGAGWDMLGPLLFFGFGIERQQVIDIRRLIRMLCIKDSIIKMACRKDELGLARVPEQCPDSAEACIRWLRDRCGIEYIAPCDAGDTGLPASSVDCITSTNTWEHIPEKAILRMLKECLRLLKPGGLLSFVIDYQDHYAYFDRSISVYNFLCISGRTWRVFNPALHYQNRLRHKDYLALFGSLGLTLVSDKHQPADRSDVELLSRLPLDRHFRTGYSLEELGIRGSHIVLRKGSLG